MILELGFARLLFRILKDNPELHTPFWVLFGAVVLVVVVYGLIEFKKIHDEVIEEVMAEMDEKSARAAAPVRRPRTPTARWMQTSTRDAVKFACPRCDKVSKVPAQLAGRKGRCPGCHTALRVPHIPTLSRAA